MWRFINIFIQLLQTLIFYQLMTCCMIVIAADAETYKPLPNMNRLYKLSDEIVNPYNFSLVIIAEPCTSNEIILIVVHSSPKVS